jgi:hypothetical protein
MHFSPCTHIAAAAAAPSLKRKRLDLFAPARRQRQQQFAATKAQQQSLSISNVDALTGEQMRAYLARMKTSPTTKDMNVKIGANKQLRGQELKRILEQLPSNTFE